MEKKWEGKNVGKGWKEMGGNVVIIILLFGPATKAWVQCHSQLTMMMMVMKLMVVDVEDVEVEYAKWNLWKRMKRGKPTSHSKKSRKKWNNKLKMFYRKEVEKKNFKKRCLLSTNFIPRMKFFLKIFHPTNFHKNKFFRLGKLRINLISQSPKEISPWLKGQWIPQSIEKRKPPRVFFKILVPKVRFVVIAYLIQTLTLFPLSRASSRQSQGL